MHQNAEERLELLHTISDIVGIEVEKRMDAFTDAEHFSARDASRAKPASGTLTSEQDKKEPYINNLSPQSVRNKRRDTNKHFINMRKKLLLLCALLISVITLSGAANRSFRTEMEQWNPIGFTQASNGMTQAQSGPQTTNRLTAGSAILPTVATAASSGVLRDGSANVITFTTAKADGETVRLYMEYSGDTPTLSGATGTPKSGDYVTYTLTSQTVTITGDVTNFTCSDNKITTLDVSQNTALEQLWCTDNQLTALDVSKNTALTGLYCYNNQLTALDVSKNTALTVFDCYNNQLTALDVSQNTALTWLSCTGNQIKGEEMTRLVNGLPDLTGKNPGEFTVLQEPDLEGNICLKSDVAIAKGKNWITKKYNSDIEAYVAYEGEEPIPYAVTLTKEGEGTLTATGAADLNAVPEGTELTIEATPAEGYGLKALTANGTDILATKKFTVRANTEVKAIFAKTYAVTLTKEGEGTLTATGATDLNAVLEGTELTIEATPAAGYELTALTANGTDILATKKFTVTADTEVKATFTKKTYAVTLTKEGEGTLTATGADDLNAVPYGTELTIEATSAAGYELKALTANGADILATKKVVVTAATTVKATFTKKTAADVVEAGTLCLYPNPAGTYVNVKAAKADALVRLYDANGTLQYEARTDADGTLQIDLSAYAEGNYLLRVGDDAQRLLIQR